MNAPGHWRSLNLWLAITSVALIAVALALYSMTRGIGADADSATYLMAARSLVSGHGLSIPIPDVGQIPMTGFAPLLPTVLAAFEFMGIDPLVGSRWLNAFLYGTDSMLVGFLIYEYTRSATVAVLGAFLAITSADVLLNHCTLISEPLFVVFSLAGLILVGLYIESPSLTLLLLFSAAFALAGATRYAGACLLPVGAASIIFGANRARRWRDLGLFLTVFGIPMSLWVLRNLTLIHALFDRTFAFHPPGLTRFVYSYLSLSTWVLPVAVPESLRILILSAGILLVLRPLSLRVGARTNGPWSLPEVGAMFLASYIMLFLLAQTFFDAQIWISGRHLLAVYLVGLVMIVCQGRQLFEQSGRYVRAGCLLLCFLAAGVGVVRVVKSAVQFHQEGIGLSSKHWQDSALVAKVKELDSRTPIFSNAGSVIYLCTGRLARALPDPVDSQTLRSRPEYSAEVEVMKRRLQQEGGVVVIFTKFAAAGELATETEIEKQLALQRVAITEDGYFLARPGS